MDIRCVVMPHAYPRAPEAACEMKTSPPPRSPESGGSSTPEPVTSARLVPSPPALALGPSHRAREPTNERARPDLRTRIRAKTNAAQLISFAAVGSPQRGLLPRRTRLPRSNRGSTLTMICPRLGDPRRPSDHAIRVRVLATVLLAATAAPLSCLFWTPAIPILQGPDTAPRVRCRVHVHGLIGRHLRSMHQLAVR